MWANNRTLAVACGLGGARGAATPASNSYNADGNAECARGGKWAASRRWPAAAALKNPLLLLLLLALLACASPRGASAARNLKAQDVAAMCVPTALEFVPVGESDAALVAARTNPTALFAAPLCSGRQSLALPNLRAVDDCGRELAVAVAVAPAPGPDGPVAATHSALEPGDALDLQGGAVPCGGAFEVVYSAELDGGDLLAEKTFTFERLCPEAAAADSAGADAAAAVGQDGQQVPPCL